jgi:hypothetical protein
MFAEVDKKTYYHPLMNHPALIPPRQHTEDWLERMSGAVRPFTLYN